MNRETYIRMTNATRAALRHLPGGAIALRLPTYVCAVSCLCTLLTLMLRRDIRLIRALFVPAACFLAVTALRPLINRQRPYDRFQAEPAGSYRSGKGKSMPSRHTASAAAIALAVMYAFPVTWAFVSMTGLCLLIAALRVLSGQHYISDVLAAIALSLLISLPFYLM